MSFGKGVPQGSVLEPLLIFNDFPNVQTLFVFPVMGDTINLVKPTGSSTLDGKSQLERFITLFR